MVLQGLDWQGRTAVGNVQDEVLILAMAVADGEASPAEQRKLGAALARDPRLAADLAAFKLTGRRLGRVFDGIAAAPVPERLLRTVMETPMGPARSAGGQGLGVLVGLRARWRDLMSNWEVPALVLAASALAFVAGGLLLSGPVTGQSGSVAQGNSQTAALGVLTPAPGLVAALATIETGAEQSVKTAAGSLSVRVVETFRDQAGTACREYEAQGSSGPRQYGVACHAATGWQLKALFEGPARTGAATTAGPGEFSETLDGIAGRLRQGEALSADEERKLIVGGW